MPTELIRVELLFTKEQLAAFRLLFPDVESDKAAIYRKLEIDPPKHGGKREGAGLKPKNRRARRRVDSKQTESRRRKS